MCEKTRGRRWDLGEMGLRGNENFLSYFLPLNCPACLNLLISSSYLGRCVKSYSFTYEHIEGRVTTYYAIYEPLWR